MGREVYILIVHLDACQRLWLGGNPVLLNKLVGGQWQPAWAGKPIEAGRFVFGDGLRTACVARARGGAPVFVSATKSPASAETLRLRSVGRLAACDSCEEIVAAQVCPLCGKDSQPVALAAGER
jgi:hypothetical protein